jgi:hypothetical protein
VFTEGCSYRGESVIGIRADKTDGTNDEYQDHSKHHCILGDVLASRVGGGYSFVCNSFQPRKFGLGLEMPTLRKTRPRLDQNSSPDIAVAIVRPRLRHVNRMDGYAKLGSGSDIQQIQHWRCLLLVLLVFAYP